jgi:hypothetical protein
MLAYIYVSRLILEKVLIKTKTLLFYIFRNHVFEKIKELLFIR